MTAIAEHRDSLQQVAEEFQAAVADLVRIYQFRDRDRICCHDVSVTQCYALETLVAAGPQRLGELASRLYLDKSTTSRVIQTLVRKGYVAQRPDPSDRRAMTVSATRKGEMLCARISDELVEQQKNLLRDLDPDVRNGVVRVLRKLADAADVRFRAGGAACCSVEPGERC